VKDNVMNASKAIINSLEQATNALRGVASGGVNATDEESESGNPLVAAFNAAWRKENEGYGSSVPSVTNSPDQNGGLNVDTQASSTKKQGRRSANTAKPSPFEYPGVVTMETQEIVAKHMVGRHIISETQANSALMRFNAYVMGLDLQMTQPILGETGYKTTKTGFEQLTKNNKVALTLALKDLKTFHENLPFA
jgi:hypothetical protein